MGTGEPYRLPLAEEAVSAPPAPERLRILVVEDDPDAAGSLLLLLTVLGHQGRAVYTGDEGVDEATAWRPDVVISDLRLPGLDGFAVARELRRDPATAAIKLIALSGLDWPEHRQAALEAGFDHFLVKPADPPELQQLLTGS